MTNHDVTCGAAHVTYFFLHGIYEDAQAVEAFYRRGQTSEEE